MNALILEGFKCFRSFELPTASLTVLTGFNAAGKSTALQSVMLMSQTLRRGLFTDKLVLNGPLAELGSTGDVLNRDSRSETLRLGFRDGADHVSWSFAPELSSDRRDLRLSEGRSEWGGASQSWKGALWQLDQVAPPLIDSVRDAICIGATRTGTVEAYPHPNDPDLPVGDVGLRGEFAPYWFVERADEKVDAARRYPSDETETVRGQIDAWLSSLFPGAMAEPDALSGVALYRSRFRMGRGGELSRPANVGYGLSYAFPLLVAFLTARADATIIVDSPEAHLHPRAQSAMGRLIARMAAAGLRIFVETHSDHLLSGIRLGVREGLLSPNEAIVHFFRNAAGEGGNPDIVTLRLDREGAISGWPEGFFDQAERDLAILSGWA